MKGIIKVSLVLAVLVSMMFVMTQVARAEEPARVNSVIGERIYQTYAEYHYPTGGRMFYLPRFHEVKFDVHNGKFFEVFYVPHYGGGIPQEHEEKTFDLRVSFYTPDGELFAVRRLGALDKNRFTTIPHNECSPVYDRLIVKLENRTNSNKDVMFKVLDPVNPVLGTPIKNANFRVLFY
jgi:hypothetical protein